MTREEAMLLLHDMKDTYDEIHENTNCEIGYEQMTALDMAIEALSADTVSREFYEDVVKANHGLAKELANLKEEFESADAEWIKVTEDTPPEFPCLVCDANGNQPFVPMGIVTITDEEHGEWHIDGRLWVSPKVFVDGEWGNQISYGNRIIAWMPLPKPYREESEVEE